MLQKSARTTNQLCCSNLWKNYKNLYSTKLSGKRVQRFSFAVTTYILAALLMLALVALGKPTEATAEPPVTYYAEYYVSASGDDTTGDGSQANPWKTLTRTANAVNSAGTTGEHFRVYVMSDLTSTACARYYNNSVTITSLDGACYTVTRGTAFSIQADTARGYYNPALLEIGNTGASLNTLPVTLTLGDIVFDDAYLHEGTTYRYAPTNGGSTGTTYVQDAIVAAYDPMATIVLDSGAKLHNFGGMTAVRCSPASLIMRSGSLITDINPNANTTRAGSAINSENGDAAVKVQGGKFEMQAGSAITRITNAHGVHASGTYSFYMNGTISDLLGGRGRDTASDGRGMKCAIMLVDGSYTLDPSTGLQGAAVIGPEGAVINNQSKSGAVHLRGGNTQLKVYGKINGNTNLAGGTLNMQGTNGAGLFIINNAKAYLEVGSEICNNRVSGLSGYGGAVSVQQYSSTLIMNGGTISGNAAPSAPGIAVNKNDASFVMNGGNVNNGNDAVCLLADALQTNGTLVLNAGVVSGVTVQNTNVHGNHTQRHLYLSEEMIIGTGYASVAGRQVRAIAADYLIGNPNQGDYAAIQAALPLDWTMPTTDGNVIAFWVQKNGKAVFTVPKPTTGAPSAGYDRALDEYFLAVVEVDAAGAALSGAPVRFYPVVDEGARVQISLELGAYKNGVMVALIQPTSAYGSLVFDGPEVLFYDSAVTEYEIPYTVLYDMPEGLRTALVTNGNTSVNTDAELRIKPDPRNIIDASTLAITSDIFVLSGTSYWDGVEEELVLALKLKDGWENATDLTLNGNFTCLMDAGDFAEGEYLVLTGRLLIYPASDVRRQDELYWFSSDLQVLGTGGSYYIPGNEVLTEMLALNSLEFDGPATLMQNLSATECAVFYTGFYETPECLHTSLINNGHTNENTSIELRISPDARTGVDVATLQIDSEVFEQAAAPYVDSLTGELVVPLMLKSSWESATDLTLNITFTCFMDADKFEAGKLLTLTGYLQIAGLGRVYDISGNEVFTKMLAADSEDPDPENPNPENPDQEDPETPGKTPQTGDRNALLLLGLCAELFLASVASFVLYRRRVI